jgi:hypothetical protein
VTYRVVVTAAAKADAIGVGGTDLESGDSFDPGDGSAFDAFGAVALTTLARPIGRIGRICRIVRGGRGGLAGRPLQGGGATLAVAADRGGDQWGGGDTRRVGTSGNVDAIAPIRGVPGRSDYAG